MDATNRGRGGRGGGGGRGRGRAGGAHSSGRVEGGQNARRRGFGGQLTDGASDASGRTAAKGKGKSVAGQDDSTEDAADAPADGENAAEEAAEDSEVPPEVELCFICAEPVKLYSLPPCDHMTCHMCAVRLRALYKKLDCTFCKATADEVIFTPTASKTFAEYTPEDLPFKDAKLAISFLTRDAMEETLLLLRFNCPETKCEVASAGWADLKSHVRREHNKMMCDLCVRNKKIFAHEHTLYNKRSLDVHMDTDHRFCEYCQIYYYSDDELFIHMRDRHEQCHICKAQGGEMALTYFRDYPALERHFKGKHWLCPNAECLEKKFIVFASEMDFKAHQLAEHGAELTSRERREALRVDAAFTYESPGESSRGGGGDRRGGRRGGKGRAGGDTRDAEGDEAGGSYLANRASVPGAASRRAAFGGSLTSAAPAAPATTTQGRSAAGGEGEDERIQQHQAFLARVKQLLRGSEAKVSSFRAAVRGYRGGEMSARDLASTIESLAEDLDAGGLIVNGLVELLEDEEKRTDVLTAWNGVRIEKTQFPSLGSGGPSAVGSGSFGYANAAQGHMEIRNIKSSASSSSRVWANVERAAAGRAVGPAAPAGRANHFPALRATGPNGKVVPGSGTHVAAALRAGAASGGARSTPWSGSSAGPSLASAAIASPLVPRTEVKMSSYATKSAGSSAAAGGPSITRQHFPGLPAPNASAAALAEKKRQVLANSRGTGRALAGGSPSGSGAATPASASGTTTPTWGASASAASPLAGVGRIDGSAFVAGAGEEATIVDGDRAASANAGGGGGKRKKKGVQLMTLGAVQRG